jgi:uncharacterized protein (DUF2141 family)
MPRPALLLIALIANLLAAGGAMAANVTVTVDQIHSTGGKVYVTLWGSKDTWLDDQKSLQNIGLPAAVGSVIFVLHDVVPGRYAIATFHDENGNGEMDFNFIGYPLEGYAFSQDTRPFLSAPTFESCAFDVGIDDTALTIHMVYP